jgi:polysaccharide pyruvyl transferase WcaK-like protein
MRIAIFAAIGAKNLWDELILKNEIQYFKHVYGKDTKFSIFTYDVKNPFIVSKKIKYLEYFPCESKKIKNIYRNIKNFYKFISVVKKSDLIVIWGGGIFFDNEWTNVSDPLKSWIFRSKIFKFFNKKVRFHSIGLNIKNTDNLDKIKDIFLIKNAEITVRDKYSHDLLKSLWMHSNIIADPVFSDKWTLKKILKTSYCLEKLHPKQFSPDDLKGYNLEWKRIWIAFRAGYFWDDDKTMTELIEYLLEKKWKIILVPNSFHPTDEQSNDFDFLERYSKIYGLPICTNMGESYTMYKENKIDICLWMRLHSMILSQVYKIPFIAFSYSKKTDEMLKIIGKKS